jgi:LmbE family N-acetylglucosaminyl deacetylase
MKNKEKWDIVVLSPHLDDAVLSLGQHIIKWKNEGKKIRIVTVFTKFGGGKNLPEYSKDYLIKSGFNSTKKFEKTRILENVKAMEKLGVDYENWGFIDAGFRGVYKTRQDLLSGEIDKRDQDLVKKIMGKIIDIKANLLLVPFGVGGHMDHVMIKKAAEDIKNKRYYLEIPYLWENFNFIKLLGKRLKIKGIMFGSDEKDKILKNYRSQYNLWDERKIYRVEVVINK